MTRRRPSAQPTPRRPVAGYAHEHEEGGNGVWYAVLISAVLLIAMGIYAFSLYQQLQESRDAADQLLIGQELLRADRDDILTKAREHEAAVVTLEAAREQDRLRLNGLEEQRRRLQVDVLKLTGDLAESRQQANGTLANTALAAELERLQREHDRLVRQAEERQVEMSSLEGSLADLKTELQATEDELQALSADKADLEKTNNALKAARARAETALSQQRQSARIRQIVRGHRASLGEVKPFIAEVGPGGWSIIESWLDLQLGRPMAVPDLSDHGWSYEGARLLGASDGPPMVMLLYADADERPVSLTIAPDRSGEEALTASQSGGLNMVLWREERHAFFLAGEADPGALEAVGIEFLNQPPRLSADAPVPESRYVRPSFKPADSS